MRTLYVLLLTALTLLAAPVAGAGTAYAAENGEWAVQPAASRLGGRPYFYLSADPGATLTDRVVITNKTSAPLTFRLYAADAYNTARDGGFAVRTADEPQHGVGAWARPDRTRVTVPPHGRVTVPYTLTVPDDAEPGDHAGALVALDERVAPAPGGGPVAMGVQRAVGARVHLRVTGPAAPALAVDDLTLTHDRPLVPGTGESTARVSYTLHNQGNVTLHPKVALRADGLFGRTLLARDLDHVPSVLLPRQKIRLTETWTGAPQLEWGDITVTATAGAVEETARAPFLALPWLPLAVLLAACAAATARLRYVRRARIGENGPHERS
ncbi:WxL protein peptidoglycan domain-containing protein [Streptomyces sp. NPDC047928]|uniref:WxL protein peptidoglycan domain-containing protein n=1 Tax=unclassified Streptomyces TaxID=2593676 RepID=UPI003712A68D